ncbi:MAG TPA: glycoside hydrolase family 3 N-terminal domain-containing protein [Candidatus Polarisedimenticolia bacterium]|nr:glycoside hydrolase family 3 N-terminal domain-containing protein [Candidatus Polarisedimenticolia bacterium]
MAPSSRLGELLFVGFDGIEVDGGLRDFLRSVRPGGIILFQRNIVSAEQVAALNAELRGLYQPRPILAVDEEGGRVSRLRSIAPTLPPAARLAAAGDRSLVADLAWRLGGILSSLGFDMDFAPVTDLCLPGAGNGIGDRSFGLDPGLATDMVAAYLEGLSRSQVAGCLKHFPGLGPTSTDSHLHLPTVTKDEEAFRREDLAPYKALKDRAPVVMVGHGHYPFWAGPDPVAATLTRRIATDLLRGEVGYRGLALADDLEMKAVAGRMPYAELAPRVIAAGCDMALVCRDREAVAACLSGLESAAASGALQHERIQEALGRVADLRATAAERPASPGPGAFRAACALLEDRLRGLA